ncbi:MAG: peptidase T [Bacteroidota bacterium]
MSMIYAVAERFMRYVQIDTQSDASSSTFPSTEKQKNLSRLLVQELQEMGIQDAELDEYGYVYATVPSNVDTPVPTICFCAHVDTSPDVSGENVKPLLHQNYQGQAITLPDDPSIVLTTEAYPALGGKHGEDIITASGKTLLGADDKAGVAIIMDLAYQLMQNPTLPHGNIRILFTPDEEIGRGVDKVNMEKLEADFGYTLDGGRLGSLEDETFSADGVTLTIHGVSAHPGYAKGKMENALRIAGSILAALPSDHLTPETTEGKEGFIHPVEISGVAERAQISFIIRDFVTEKLSQHESTLKDIVEGVMIAYPGSWYAMEIEEQYRNMKTILDQHPEVVQYAAEAIEEAGLVLHKGSIRGGTDGSRLSFMGLPCPNIFAGEQAIHSKYEWVSVQDMERAVKVLIKLSEKWAESSNPSEE